MKRRLEIYGEAAGVTVYDDFAHHPTAIAETLAGLRAANPHKRIWAIFEPRSASSSRRVFQQDFARAFGPADEVIIAPVFRTSLPEAERLSAQELVRDLKGAGQRARAAASIDDIVTTIVKETKSRRPGRLHVERRLWRHPSENPAGAWCMSQGRVAIVGDTCVSIEFGTTIDDAINARCVAFARLLEGLALDGVRDVVPTYNAVTVHFDPRMMNRGLALHRNEGACRADRRAKRAPIRGPSKCR